MDAGLSAVFEAYRALLAMIDEECGRLKTVYGEQIRCRAGCRDCCMPLEILPLEFAAMRFAAGLELPADWRAFGGRAEGMDCAHMNADGTCGTYPLRPVICRTHGFPLAYCPDGEDWMVTICELNDNPASDGWDAESLLNMEEINASLVQLDGAFRALLNYDGPDRVSLCRVLTPEAR